MERFWQVFFTEKDIFMKQLLLSLITALLLVGCTDKGSNNEKYLPASVGKINTVSVVIDDELWKGAVGDTIRRYFAAAIDGLPNEEPLFTLRQMPPQVFQGNTRNSRNILIVQRGDKPKVTIEEDVYARPQVIATVQTNKIREICCKIEEYNQQLIEAFRENELKETLHRFENSLNTETATVETLGVKLKMPSLYKSHKYGTNFFWIERDIKGGKASVILYEMPLGSIPNEGVARAQAIVKMRDSIGKLYIPGPEKGMYMVTESYLAPSIKLFTFKDRKTIESKGLWEVKNFALGGPYINYIIEDQENNRLLVVEGFMYAPQMPKRDVMFELEAIIKSIEFKNNNKQ